MGPWPPTVGRFSDRLKRLLSRIQVHRRIERVKTHLAGFRVMKSAAGKGLNQVREGDAADVNEFQKSKN